MHKSDLEVPHFQYPVKHQVTTMCCTNWHNLICQLKFKSVSSAWKVFFSCSKRIYFLCCIHFLQMESVQKFTYNCFWQSRWHFSSDYKEMKHKPTFILITFLSFHIYCSSPFLIYDFTILSIIATLCAVLSITIVTLVFSVLHNTII